MRKSNKIEGGISSSLEGTKEYDKLKLKVEILIASKVLRWKALKNMRSKLSKPHFFSSLHFQILKC